MAGLNARQRRILLFEESQALRSETTRTQAIWAQFGVNEATYQQELSAALAHPDAARVAPSLVRWRGQQSQPEKLPDDVRELLLFEAQWRPRPGETKAQAVRARFGVSFATYRARLNHAIAHPAAGAAFPWTVALNGGTKGRVSGPVPDQRDADEQAEQD